MVLERQSGRGKLIVCNSDQTRQEVQEYFGYSGKTVWLPLSIFRHAGPETLPSLYNAADFAVCTSLYESFGYVVAEGLTCGVPVVASLGGACGALLRHTPLEHLLVADAHSCRDFEAAIRAVLGDRDLHRQIVVRLIRPEIEKKMEPENWLRRFREVTSL